MSREFFHLFLLPKCFQMRMPFRACTSFLLENKECKLIVEYVSMPSRACTSLLLYMEHKEGADVLVCQCPLGLIPHCYMMLSRWLKLLKHSVSMPSQAYTSLLLKPFEIDGSSSWIIVSMPSRAYTSLLLIALCGGLFVIILCQCPLGLIPHCYILEKVRIIMHS